MCNGSHSEGPTLRGPRCGCRSAPLFIFSRGLIPRIPRRHNYRHTSSLGPVNWWECEQPVCGPRVTAAHSHRSLCACANKGSAVRTLGQKAGLWARPGGVRWIKERCGKGGISRRDHRHEEKRQIYRIQRSPGKRARGDALALSGSEKSGCTPDWRHTECCCVSPVNKRTLTLGPRTASYGAGDRKSVV